MEVEIRLFYLHDTITDTYVIIIVVPSSYRLYANCIKIIIIFPSPEPSLVFYRASEG